MAKSYIFSFLLLLFLKNLKRMVIYSFFDIELPDKDKCAVKFYLNPLNRSPLEMVEMGIRKAKMDKHKFHSRHRFIAQFEIHEILCTQ